MKENNKNTKIENLQNGEGKVQLEKPCVRVQLGQKLKKNYNFLKFQFEIAFNGYLDKFLS